MAPASSKWEEKSSALIAQLKAYYRPDSVGKPPALAVSTAAALTVLFTVLYVAPFYLSSTLRSTTIASRNTPSVIKARIRAVVLTCLLSTVITVSVLGVRGRATPQDSLRLLGLFPVHLVDIAKCVLLVCILFIGPLFEAGVVEGQWRNWFKWSLIRQTVYDDWTGWRNLVVGPASEELVFRSLAIALFLLTKASPTYVIFVSPLIFGIAHLHHLHEFVVYHRRPQVSYVGTLLTPSVLLPGLLRSLFQFAYTSLFGIFAAFVFLRTGNVWACFAVHSFCNHMGFPRLWGRVGEGLGGHAGRTLDNRRGETESASVRDAAEALKAGADDQDLGIQWTVAYYILIFAGAAGFWKMLWPLTESDRALARF
ncbi:hypothetical protein MBLNU459_g3490t1 [Dothideomycetes sp. NU459]